MTQEEPGTHAWDYDGSICPWCGMPCEFEPCSCPMATAMLNDEMREQIRVIVDEDIAENGPIR